MISQHHLFHWCKWNDLPSVIIYTVWSQFGMAIRMQIKCKCTLQKEEVSTQMTTWTFSLLVSEHTSSHMSSTWEGNWKCTLELKRWESCNGLKGRSWIMTLPQVSMVFSSHLIIRQKKQYYTFIQMTKMLSSWTSVASIYHTDLLNIL